MMLHFRVFGAKKFFCMRSVAFSQLLSQWSGFLDEESVCGRCFGAWGHVKRVFP